MIEKGKANAIWCDDDFSQQIAKVIRWSCAVCGDEGNVTLGYEEGEYYSEETGSDPNTFSVHCHNCNTSTVLYL